MAQVSPLMQNALDSIAMGVEDYRSQDPRRAGSAVRNFFAGVLLLLKEKLRRESPPHSNGALISERVEFRRGVAGELTIVGTGKKSIDVRGIQERFKSLGLALDTSALNKLQDIRNYFEHNAPAHSHASVQEAIARTFALVASVLEQHLGGRPCDLLGAEVWQEMLRESDTFNQVMAGCTASIRGIDGAPAPALAALRDVSCPSCGSSLMRAVPPEQDYFLTAFACQACGAESNLTEVIPRAVARLFGYEAYDVRDGGEHSIGTCPSCDAEAFHVPSDACLVCGERRPYARCERCAETLGLDEQESGLCGYCEHVGDQMFQE